MKEGQDDLFYLTPTLSRIQNSIQMQQSKRNSSSTSNNIHNNAPSNLFLNGGLAATQLGLDPMINKRHAPIVHHDNYSFDNWPASHTFPMDKFRMTAYSLLNDSDDSMQQTEATTESGQFRGDPLVLSPTHFYKPLSLEFFPTSFLSPPVCPNYLRSFLSGTLTKEQSRLIGFREHTSRHEIIQRTVTEVAGTVLTAQLALKYGLASHTAGGTHHAQSGEGRGFTILNDLAVVASLMTWKEEDEVEGIDDVKLLREFYRGNGAKRVLVVDLDVHQGDGTATFHAKGSLLHNKLFTLDLHATNNYPFQKQQCTYDVSLSDECNDDEYMEALIGSLDKAIQEVDPQLILYNAGVDPYQHDKLGRLSLSWEGLRQRDDHVIRKCVDERIPVACVVGGGYDVDVRALGRRHALVSRVCGEIWREKEMWQGIKD
jgi:acetoin utilization deacetylase AcuC-like enzyme